LRRERELPVYMELGDLHGTMVCKANIALALLQRNAAGDRAEAAVLLDEALDWAQSLRLPEAEQITAIVKEHGLDSGQSPASPEIWQRAEQRLAKPNLH